MIERILVIADDFTGATDIGAAFVETGRTVRVHLTEAAPRSDAAPVVDDATADVEIFALKTRSSTAAESVRVVRDVLRRAAYNPLRDQLYFKYCSTFDSTDEGNIGPVLDTLQEASGARLSVVIPAYPDNGRTQYQGYLFVGDQLLAESHMRDHPITPMRDSSVLRLLGAQTRTQCELVALETVRGDSLGSALSQERSAPVYAVVDAVSREDLTRIARQVQSHALVSGGAGLAKQYPVVGSSARVGLTSAGSGGRVIIAGSQSTATKRQLALLAAQTHIETFVIDAMTDGSTSIAQCTEWLKTRVGAGKTVLVRRPDLLAEGTPEQELAERIESVLAAAARASYDLGVREFMVAGGESSASVVRALEGVTLSIGPSIDEGVPWCVVTTADGGRISIALKSGNFGADDFFVRGWEVLDA
ncbi:MAG: four-carbon acid sugar kinase family protein [Leucobacter sp.]|nr:four-carbon acid sugar kinase family protein [Leucobacter sp.]